MLDKAKKSGYQQIFQGTQLVQRTRLVDIQKIFKELS